MGLRAGPEPFRKAIRWGMVTVNPCTGIERFHEKPRERYVEDWEFQAFREFVLATSLTPGRHIRHTGPLIAAYLDFKLLTDLRKGDILSIKSEHLKDDGIHVHISKTKKDIIIEWTDALRKSVHTIRSLPRPRKVTGLYLFCTREGRPYTVTGFSSIWQRKMKAAIEQGVIRERFTDHDLRAKSASDTDIEHATRLLAHLDRKTTQQHYRRKAEKVRPLR